MSSDIIDRTALKRLLDVIGGDPDDLAELLEEFERTTPKLLADLEAAAEIGDVQALRIASHSLKSNGRDFGALALSEACKELEAACSTGHVEDAAARVSVIGDELGRARAALSGIAI